MVALYIRLSRLDDDLDEYKQESNSVENQRKLLYDYLAEMPDLREEETEEFVDDGWSGTNFQRPAFLRMLGLIKSRTVTTVVVKDFSRFGRNYVECADYLEKIFPFLGTRFISVSDNYDSGKKDEDRQIEIAMKNIVNSYYSQDLSKKITSTFNMKREKGEFFFTVPFGYLKDTEHPGKVVIDEEAAVIVRHIYSLACKGWRTSDIAKILNKEDIPTMAAYNRMHSIKGKGQSREKSEYAAWTGSKVKQLLKNEIYMGTYVAQKSRRPVSGMKKTVRVEDSMRIPDNHPAIVDKETFEKAQEIFMGPRVKDSEEKRYQLKSKVVCGNCGYSMAYNDNIYEDCYFYCIHTQKTGNHVGCPTERFPEELLNARVFTQLKQWIMMLSAACGSVDEAEQKRWEGLRLLSEEAECLQDDLKEQQRKKVELYESYSDGQISREDFIEKKAKLAAGEDSIRAELDSLHGRESKLKRLRNRRKPELDELMSKVSLFEKETRLTCAMAETFVEQVTVYDKWHIEITWKCEDLVEAALNEAAETEEVLVETGKKAG